MNGASLLISIKSVLHPVTVIAFLGLWLDFKSRAFRPAPVHARRFFQLASLFDDHAPLFWKQVILGLAAFLLSVSVKLFPFFPFSLVRIRRYLQILYACTRLIIPMATPDNPGRRTVAVDATPHMFASLDLNTGVVSAQHARGHQTHNELRPPCVLYFQLFFYMGVAPRTWSIVDPACRCVSINPFCWLVKRPLPFLFLVYDGFLRLTILPTDLRVPAGKEFTFGRSHLGLADRLDSSHSPCNSTPHWLVRDWLTFLTISVPKSTAPASVSLSPELDGPSI